jgi:hypothetical protein
VAGFRDTPYLRGRRRVGRCSILQQRQKSGFADTPRVETQDFPVPPSVLTDPYPLRVLQQPDKNERARWATPAGLAALRRT